VLPRAGLTTSSPGYFVRTENLQALPKTIWRRWVKERWRIKMASSLTRFGGIRLVLRVFCQNGKSPGTPKLASVWKPPGLLSAVAVMGIGKVPPWGWDTGQELENKMVSSKCFDRLGRYIVRTENLQAQPCRRVDLHALPTHWVEVLP